MIRIKKFFKALRRKDKKAIRTAVIVGGIALLVILFVIIKLMASDKKNQSEETTLAETTTEATTEPVTAPQEENHDGMVKSQLTGQWINAEAGLRRPVAVMLNNLKPACPQTGISKAGVIYETPVEGGICRFEAFFDDYDGLDKIGSVRSARTYHAYFSAQFDAIFLHFGQAYYALDALSQIDNLSGLEGVGSTVYYRTSDRVAPHNAYTSAKGIADGIVYKGYDSALPAGYKGPYTFANDGEQINLSSNEDAVTVTPGYKINAPWFVYNATDGLYYRFQYDGQQIDDMTNAQLTCKNIILQYCNYESYYGTEYLNIFTTGSGSGKYITNGKAIDITWKNDNEFGQTHYYDSDGNEIRLNQGQTWVCIVINKELVDISPNAR